jgi:ribosomal protein S18 acetylase RimI-like enzyme
MTQEKFTWQVEVDPSDEAIAALRSRLRAYNMAQVDTSDDTSLAIFLRDEAGELLGGISGFLWGAVLEIDFLWIDDSLRGQGVGKQLVLQLEDAARQRNGRTVILDTFSFQAPDFYQSLGYEITAVVEGFGNQHGKYFLRKSLV